MSKYTKTFNILQQKNSDRVVSKLQADLLDVSYNGNEGRLEKGAYLTTRTTDEQKEDLAKGLQEGRMDQDLYDKRMERLNKIPDFVFGHIHAVVDNKYYPIGDILNRRDGKGKYIKVKADQLIFVDQGEKVLVKRDGFINMKTKKEERERIDYILGEGKMKEETHERIVKDLNDIPDFVIYLCDARGEEL